MRAMPSKQAYQWRYFETMANNVFDLHNDAKNVNLNSTTSGGGAGGGLGKVYSLIWDLQVWAAPKVWFSAVLVSVSILIDFGHHFKP